MEGRFVVDSRFRTEEYAPPAGTEEVYNVQVWSVPRAYTAALAGELLAALAAWGKVDYLNAEGSMPALPQVFVRRGEYRQGRLLLEIYNAAGAAQARLTGGTLARSESEARELFKQDLKLPAPAAQAAAGRAAERIVEVEVPDGPCGTVVHLERMPKTYRVWFEELRTGAGW